MMYNGGLKFGNNVSWLETIMSLHSLHVQTKEQSDQ